VRSRLALGAAVLSLAAVSAGGVAVAASGDEAEPKTIVVATHQIDFAVGVHAGAPGSPPETAGDTIVIRQQLRNAAGDVGSATILCTVAFHREFACDADVDLAGRGHIVLEGVTARGPAALAVTGGTGEFSLARGEATLVGAGNVDQQLTIRLR